MKKAKVIGAVVAVLVVVIAIRSCGSGSSDSEADLPSVNHGQVELPTCSSSSGSVINRVDVLQQQGNFARFVGIKACVGLKSEALSKLKAIGSAGLPAGHDAVLVVKNIDQGKFQICGVSDDVSLSEPIPATAVVCPGIATSEAGDTQ
ncbi:hypothetical protein ACN95_03235 [Gordonia sihwensis]|uniref:hypothetical protein n=1 Tax=Gordonia sihwensis TaxID=173559 RepID=UPI001C92E99E|nr:hypothetical protein [Gordonia sihwensis]MBY4569033.1 hypothetical protein [Gordonia sihwensis]